MAMPQWSVRAEDKEVCAHVRHRDAMRCAVEVAELRKVFTTVECTRCGANATASESGEHECRRAS